MPFKQDELAMSCPVVYGTGGFPIIILLCFYLINLLVTTREIIYVFSKSTLKKNLTKKAFLLLISLFLFMRCLCFLIPFPFNRLGYLLVCDQLPRIGIFLGWQLLALWLGSAVLASFAKNRASKAWLSVGFIVLFLILLSGSIVVSVYSQKIEAQGSSFTRDRLVSIIDCVNYFVILISILIYWVRLVQICRRIKDQVSFRTRIIVLLVLIFIMFAIFLARFCYVLCYTFNVNVVQQLIEKAALKAVSDELSWSIYYTIYLFFYFLFEISPTVTLLVTYFLLSVHTITAKREKKALHEKAFPISKRAGGASRAERGTRKQRDRDREREREREQARLRQSLKYRKEEGDASIYLQPHQYQGRGDMKPSNGYDGGYGGAGYSRDNPTIQEWDDLQQVAQPTQVFYYTGRVQSQSLVPSPTTMASNSLAASPVASSYSSGVSDVSYSAAYPYSAQPASPRPSSPTVISGSSFSSTYSTHTNMGYQCPAPSPPSHSSRPSDRSRPPAYTPAPPLYTPAAIGGRYGRFYGDSGEGERDRDRRNEYAPDALVGINSDDGLDQIPDTTFHKHSGQRSSHSHSHTHSHTHSSTSSRTSKSSSQHKNREKHRSRH